MKHENTSLDDYLSSKTSQYRFLLTWLVFTLTGTSLVANYPGPDTFPHSSEVLSVMIAPDLATTKEAVEAARTNDTYKTAISLLGRKLSEQGITVLDLAEQAIVQKNRTMLNGQSITNDPFVFFSTYAPAEVIVYLNVSQIQYDNGDHQLKIQLSAKDKYTYERLASSLPFTSYRRHYAEPTQQLREAFRSDTALIDFTSQLLDKWKKIQQFGRKVTLRVEAKEPQKVTLDSIYGNHTLTSHLQVILNQIGSSSSIGRTSSTATFFETTLSVPVKTPENSSYSPLDFGLSLQSRLRNIIPENHANIELKTVGKFIYLYLQKPN